MAIDEKARLRRQRREIRLQNSESVWLQKALFALRKAEDARDKLAEVREDEPAPYVLEVADQEVEVEALEDALEERVQTLVKTVRERRRQLR